MRPRAHGSHPHLSACIFSVGFLIYLNSDYVEFSYALALNITNHSTKKRGYLSNIFYCELFNSILKFNHVYIYTWLKGTNITGQQGFISINKHVYSLKALIMVLNIAISNRCYSFEHSIYNYD